VDLDGGGADADSESTEVIRYYDLWSKIANFAGKGPYDAADWKDGSLYFRSDYSEKHKKWPEWAENGYWGAWIITSAPEGYFCVVRSLLHERAALRSEDIEVMFSRFSDAGKFVISQIGDSVRSSLQLRTLFIKWDDRGLDPRIRIEPASKDTVDFLNRECPTLKEGFAEQHLKRYTFEEAPSSHGFALPAQQPRMEVLTLSFEELTAALLDGMPESITSKVPAWRQ
jgi:hypothetical protein